MNLYRIHWRAVITGATGHGTGKFSFEEASKIAESLNEKNSGVTEHWVELCESDDADKYLKG